MGIIIYSELFFEYIWKLMLLDINIYCTIGILTEYLMNCYNIPVLDGNTKLNISMPIVQFIKYSSDLFKIRIIDIIIQW